MKEVREYLRNMYLEREEVVDGLLVSLVARQHALLIGPPGTAKSAIITDLAKCITGCNYFQWLLTRFSTPEELFGPVSLKALEQDVYKRNTSQKLPEAHVAFVDEIFKANSAILNSLLTLINERLFYNNGSVIHAPLSSLIGASNEYPEDEEGLEALFDRFLLRYEVGYISDPKNFLSMLKGDGLGVKRPTVSLQEIETLQTKAEMMTNIPDDIFQTIGNIRDDLKKEGIIPSDRRFRQCLSLLKASAVLDGRTAVERKDLGLLKYSLWVSPEAEEKDVVRQVVDEYSLDPTDKQVAGIEQAVKEIAGQLHGVDFNDTNKVVEINSKIKTLLEELNKLPQEREDVERLTRILEDNKKEIAKAVLGV